jgi:hypothetical protein
MTTTTCPGCGEVINLVEVPGKPGRLQGFCGCNKGRAVIEMDKPKVRRRKGRKDEPSILDGDNGTDGGIGAIPEVP